MVTTPLSLTPPIFVDFNDFATRGTMDVERYKKQSAEFRKKVNITTATTSATKTAAVVPAKGKQAEAEDEDEDEESYDSMDYGDEFNDDEESGYKKEKIGE